MIRKLSFALFSREMDHSLSPLCTRSLFVHILYSLYLWTGWETFWWPKLVGVGKPFVTRTIHYLVPWTTSGDNDNGLKFLDHSVFPFSGNCWSIPIKFPIVHVNFLSFFGSPHKICNSGSKNTIYFLYTVCWSSTKRILDKLSLPRL